MVLRYLLFLCLIFSCKQISPKVESFESSTPGAPLDKNYLENREDIKVDLTGLPTSDVSIGTYSVEASGLSLSHYAIKEGLADSIDCELRSAYTIYEIGQSATIDISQSDSGDYKACVIGQSKNGAWQDRSEAKEYFWTYNKTEDEPFREPPSELGGDPGDMCRDALPPPSEDGVTYGCDKQKEWGKCGRDWMQDYCKKTCGRC
jgi:hypothetical protein